jgi:3-hydroxybutyryl-CoA dehydrogenase
LYCQMSTGKADCSTAMSEKSSYTIGIAGSGRMGSDIFYYLSDYECSLVWLCVSGQERDVQQRFFEKKIGRLYSAGALTREDRDRLVGKTRITCEMRDLACADVVIEAITEDLGAKRAFFTELTGMAGRDSVMATNTSSILPSLIADPGMGRERFAGLHFFYPVKLKNIAEITRTDHTSEKSMDLLRGLLRMTGMQYLEMHESNGFVLNRIFLDLQAQAWRFCEQGLAGARCIDSIVRADLFPSGVFEMFDAIGLDVACASVENYAGYAGDTSFYEPLVRELKRLVSHGKIGRKSGEGFYRYPDETPDGQVECGGETRRAISSVLRSLYLNAACRALETGAFERERLENAIRECAAADRGPFAMLDETGPNPAREILSELYARTGFNAYRPSLLLIESD